MDGVAHSNVGHTGHATAQLSASTRSSCWTTHADDAAQLEQLLQLAIRVKHVVLEPGQAEARQHCSMQSVETDLKGGVLVRAGG